MRNQQIELDNVESFYDECGIQYSLSRTKEGMLFNDFIERPALQGLIQDLENYREKPVTNVLDIGCGPGLYSRDLTNSGKKVIALDISQKMISSARKFCEETLSDDRLKDIEFIHSSFEAFQPEDQFDLVLATFMLGYFHDLEAFFTKIRQALDSQGQFIASMLHPVRTFSEELDSGNGYFVSKYFSDGFYRSGFVGKTKNLNLNRWHIEDVATASFNSGLVIERILEPRLAVEPPPSCSKEQAKFFANNPSIIIFMMRRR